MFAQIWLRSDGRECNAGMTIAKCTKTAVSSTIATIFLARQPLGSLVVRLITGDPIGISGVTYLCVAIRSLSIVSAKIHAIGGACGSSDEARY